jgi:hypothetical protein
MGKCKSVDSPKLNVQWAELDIGTVCETFNRLIRIERETSADMSIPAVLCGLLNAIGYGFDKSLCGVLMNRQAFGMTPEDLGWFIELHGVEYSPRCFGGSLAVADNKGGDQ